MDEIKKTVLLLLVERARGVAARIEEEKNDKPRDKMLIRRMEGKLDAIRDMQDIFLGWNPDPWYQCFTLYRSCEAARMEEAAKESPDKKKLEYWEGRKEGIKEFAVLWAKKKELHTQQQAEFLQLADSEAGPPA